MALIFSPPELLSPSPTSHSSHLSSGSFPLTSTASTHFSAWSPLQPPFISLPPRSPWLKAWAITSLCSAVHHFRGGFKPNLNNPVLRWCTAEHREVHQAELIIVMHLLFDISPELLNHWPVPEDVWIVNYFLTFSPTWFFRRLIYLWRNDHGCIKWSYCYLPINVFPYWTIESHLTIRTQFVQFDFRLAGSFLSY